MSSPFIDPTGWEPDDPHAHVAPLSSRLTAHAAFLRQAERTVRQQAVQQQRRSRYEQLYKERLKLPRPQRDPAYSVDLPTINSQSPHFITVNTLDLGSPRERPSDSLPASQTLRPRELPRVSPKPHHQPPKKKPPKPQAAKAEPRQDLGRRSFLLCHQEDVNELALRHLRHYLRERQQEQLRTTQRIFQLPLGRC